MTCKICGGTGVITYQENQAPLGSGLVWNESIEDDCKGCTELDICPQCDMDWDEETVKLRIKYLEFDEDNFNCPVCGWSYV